MAFYLIMGELYYTLFIIIFPIMCFFTNFVVAIILLFRKNNERKEEAKRILIVGAFGSIAGYIIASIYFYLTRDETFLSVVELSCIGFLVGAGYAMILFSILPRRLRLKGLVEEQ